MNVLDLFFNFFFDWIKHAQGNCTRHSNLQNRNTIFSNGPSKPIIQRNRTSHKKPKSVNLLFFIFVVQYLKSVTAASCSFGIKEILFIAFWYSILCVCLVFICFLVPFFFSSDFFKPEAEASNAHVYMIHDTIYMEIKTHDENFK